MEFKDILPQKFVNLDGRGKYVILGLEPQSRTKVRIKDVDRGAGHNAALDRFTGIIIESGWYRGENYGYGDELICHRKRLALIEHPDKSE